MRLFRLFQHRLVKDSLVLLGVQITGYLLPLITLPYLTRVLGPSSFGLLTLGSALVLYFYVITEYGFAVTGTRRVAIVQEDISKVSAVYSAIMACKLGLLVLCFLTLCGLLVWIPKLHQYWQLYLVSFLQVLGWCLSPTWLLQGMQRMRFIAYSDYGAKIVLVAMIFVLVHKPSDYLRAAALQSGGFVISALIGMVLVFGVLKIRLVWPPFEEMKTAMIAGLPVFFSMASLTAISSTNTMILGMVAQPDQVGFLGAGMRLITAARALTNPITTAVYPHMSRVAARSRSEGIRMMQKQLLWTAAPFLLITLVLAFFSPLVVQILYRKAYAETGVLLRIMCLTPFVHAVSMCFGTYYMLAFGYEKEWSKIVTRMLILNFITLFLLMLVMRPVRAVAATTTIMDIYSATASYLFYRRTAKAAKTTRPVNAVELTPK